MISNNFNCSYLTMNLCPIPNELKKFLIYFQDVKQLNRRENRTHLLSNKYGFAGYDNELDSMQSLLILRHGIFAKEHFVIGKSKVA
jgi:hypothetical protein